VNVIDNLMHGQTRDFTYIDDCIKVFNLLNKKINCFNIINSSRGENTNINKLANKIVKLLNSKSKIRNISVPKKLIEFQVEKKCGDSSKLFKLINYKPNTNIEVGLKKTILIFINNK